MSDTIEKTLKALKLAEPYVETLHSLLGFRSEARRQVRVVLKEIRAAIEAAEVD